jgi:hypothetical protein
MRFLSTIQRYAQDLEESAVGLDDNRVPRLVGTRDEFDQGRAENAILEFLTGQEEPQTENEIDEAIEGKTKHKRGALRARVTAGRVTRSGGGKKGDPYRYELASNSRLLVPAYRGEQGNENPNSGVNVEKQDGFSRSQDLPPDESAGEGREQESDQSSEREEISL